MWEHENYRLVCRHIGCCCKGNEATVIEYLCFDIVFAYTHIKSLCGIVLYYAFRLIVDICLVYILTIVYKLDMSYRCLLFGARA